MADYEDTNLTPEEPAQDDRGKKGGQSSTDTEEKDIETGM